MEVIHGKPIKKLRVDLKGKNDALDLQDDLADLFAAKSGNDMFMLGVNKQKALPEIKVPKSKKEEEGERPYSPTYVASPPRGSLSRQNSDRQPR